MYKANTAFILQLFLFQNALFIKTVVFIHLFKFKSYYCAFLPLMDYTVILSYHISVFEKSLSNLIPLEVTSLLPRLAGLQFPRLYL